MKKYDLIIIGGGGGLKLVGPALKKKKKIAVIEKDRLGGTCLTRGCIPSKMMIYPAYIAQHIKEARKFGIVNNTKFKTKFGELTKRISNTIFTDSDGIKTRYKKNPNIDFYNKEAKFVKDKVLKVGKEEITGTKIVIAVGARPFVPPIPGLEGTPYMTSTEALRSDKLPKKLIVIGGGYIAVELGNAYAALGSEVHFLVRGRMVAREDGEVIDAFEKEFAKLHHVHQEISTDKIVYKNKKFTVTLSDLKGKKRTVSGDGLLVATGVKPNNDTLDLQNTKIKTNKFGFIQVNKSLETGVPGVYAMGDCVGNYMFRHSANFEGEYLADKIYGSEKGTIKYPPVPHAIFTTPQIAGVGATEEELKEQKIPYVVGKNDYIQSAMGQAMLSEYGFAKLMFHKKTKKLLGAHIMGPEASIMIQSLITHMTNGGTVDTILKEIYIHPAMPEIVRNAARKAKKQLK